MSEYEQGMKDGRDRAIKLLCEMIDQTLSGHREEFNPRHPHSATFERLVRRLDKKLN